LHREDDEQDMSYKILGNNYFKSLSGKEIFPMALTNQTTKIN